MKYFFPIYLSIFFACAGKAFIVQPIDGINGEIEIVEFDSDGNSYVLSNTNTVRHLYKLNLAKEIQWIIDNIGYVWQILINPQNDVYFLSDEDSIFNYNYLGIIREDDLHVEKIISKLGNTRMMMDGDGNIFYNGENGIFMLRPNSKTPMQIKNLEGWRYNGGQVFAVDSIGNVYFGVQSISSDQLCSIAVVTKEAKEEEIPYATRYNTEIGYRMSFFEIDENNGLWAFTSSSYFSQIINFSNGVVEGIVLDYNYEQHIAKAVKNRIYIVSITDHSDTAPTYFITLNGTVGEIPDLNNVTKDVFKNTKIVADKDGNTYFGSYYPYDKGAVVLIKPDGVNTTGIDFGDTVNVLSMMLDENEDLWVGTDGQGIYRVKKGETIPEIATRELSSIYTGYININKKTNEVFIFSRYGLYFVDNSSN